MPGPRGARAALIIYTLQFYASRCYVWGMGAVMEDVIASYRAELVREGALDPDTLDELEDHFRESIASRTRLGMNLEAAVAEARAALGEPKVLARECGRVRTSFAPRPERWVSWVLVGLMITWYVALLSDSKINPYGMPLALPIGGRFVLGSIVVAIALSFRSPQALAIVAGFACARLSTQIPLALYDLDVHAVPHQTMFVSPVLLVELAILGLVITRGPRFTRGSFAIALLAWTFCLISVGSFGGGPLRIMLLLPLLAGAGTLLIGMRARGAWIPCVAIFAVIAPELVMLVTYIADYPLPVIDWLLVANAMIGLIAPLAAAFLVRTNTRSLRDALQPLRDRINGAPPTQAA